MFGSPFLSVFILLCDLSKPICDPTGMIMWQKAKRAVSIDTARSIANVARASGAQPVGVFVDEDAQAIMER